MSITNPLSITFGDQEVGGATAYQIHGPHSIDKSYGALRLSFDVIVIGESFEDLQERSTTIESAFRRRLTNGETLVIDADGTAVTYTAGSTLLGVTSALAKAANPATDRGFSRAYTVTIEGQLPADATEDGGLRDIEVQTSFSPSRQKTVTMRGVYTATAAGTALERYTDAFDAKATGYLTLIDSSATWELVGETYSLDRAVDDGGEPIPDLLNFTRQYVQLLVNQSSDSLDDTEIRDHRITFSDVSSYPGDGAENLTRLQRVNAVFDCGVDIDETTDLQTVFTEKVKPYLISLFSTEFSPQAFGIEEERPSYDESGKRMSVAMVFVYQPTGADLLVEVSQSVTIRETRTIDYTPVHKGGELDSYADLGWATKERIWTRTAVSVGATPPAERLTGASGRGAASVSRSSAFNGEIGGMEGPDARGGGSVSGIGDAITAGWNVVASTSQVTPSWIGKPGTQQLLLSTLNESVIERYHQAP